MTIRNRKNDQFCVVPWVHVYLSPQAERRLCCMAQEDNSPTLRFESLDEFWNGNYIKNIRSKFLKGEFPSECTRCFETTASYKDYYTKIMFPDIASEILNNSDEDGTTALLPRSFDYRVSNKCNYKCIICGDLFSSRWEQEKVEMDKVDTDRDWWILPNTRQNIENFHQNIAIPELIKVIELGDLEEIYWSGGESLLWDIHWSIMQKLVDLQMSKKVVCRYNTNLSCLTYDRFDLLDDYFPNFKKIFLDISLDAIETTGEYIRSGMKWKSWLKNFKRVIDARNNAKNIEVNIHMTMTLPGLAEVEKIIKFAVEHDVLVDVEMVYPNGVNFVLSPLVLPKDIFIKLINEKIAFCFKRSDRQSIAMLNYLTKLKKEKLLVERFKSDYIDRVTEGKRQLLEIEKNNKGVTTISDIYSSTTPLYGWWSGL